jgi:hypothetical protein
MPFFDSQTIKQSANIRSGVSQPKDKRTVGRTLLGPAVGDEQVARALGQDTCFAAVAVLSSEHRDTIEFVPKRQRSSSRRALLLL